MRVAALYDIHGNLPALRAVLADAAREGVHTFVIGGDVAAGPLPRGTLDKLIALGPRARYVRGNMDREVVDAYDYGPADTSEVEDPDKRVAAFAASRIPRRHRDFLDGFASIVELEVDGIGPTVFCHGSPRGDRDGITRVTSDERLREILRGVQDSAIVCGHTHQQFDRSIDGWRVINPGSVGVPYEGEPGAYWALLGPELDLRRSEYDLRQAVPELRASGFPDLDEMLRESLLEPVDPDEISVIFEREAIGER
jgi:putative phosphoesterase